MKIKVFKNNAYTVFEKTFPAGLYAVRVYDRIGNLVDKVLCDDYRDACAYLKSFNQIARNS